MRGTYGRKCFACALNGVYDFMPRILPAVALRVGVGITNLHANIHDARDCVYYDVLENCKNLCPQAA